MVFRSAFWAWGVIFSASGTRKTRFFPENGRITAGQLTIRCPEGLEYSAEEKPVTDTRMARNWPGSLWRVMLKGSPGNRFRTTFVFSAKDREA